MPLHLVSWLVGPRELEHLGKLSLRQRSALSGTAQGQESGRTGIWGSGLCPWASQRPLVKPLSRQLER